MTDCIDVSIIIVNYNTKDILAECLRSIVENVRHVRYETIVVDNASTDGSAEMVAREFPQVNLIACTENHGFAKGNNIGLETAKGAFVFYLNPDAMLLNDAVDRLHRFLVENPGAGMVGPRLFLDEARKHHPSIRTYTTPSNIVFRYLPGYKLLHQLYEGWAVRKTSVQCVDWLVGAALMAPRQLLQELKGFDEAFFVYSEEEDLCRRVNRAGKLVVYYPDAEVIHIGGASSKQTPGLATKFFWDSQMTYLLRYYRKNEVRKFVKRFSRVLTLKARLSRKQSEKQYLEQIVTVIKQHSPP